MLGLSSIAAFIAACACDRRLSEAFSAADFGFSFLTGVAIFFAGFFAEAVFFGADFFEAAFDDFLDFALTAMDMVNSQLVSMVSTEHLKSTAYFHYLGDLVKKINAGSQFQAVKVSKDREFWLLSLDFFPAPRNLLFSSEAKLLKIYEKFKSKGVKASEHPAQLYMKAHFLNLRIKDCVSLSPEAIAINFSPDGFQIKLRFEEPSLIFEMTVPGRPTFQKEMRLASLADSVGAPAQEIKEQVHESKKTARLIKNIEGDLLEAEAWLKEFEPICEVFEMNSTLWSSPEEVPAKMREILEKQIALGLLPPWGKSSVGRALDVLFKWRRRYLKKSWWQSSD